MWSIGLRRCCLVRDRWLICDTPPRSSSTHTTQDAFIQYKRICDTANVASLEKALRHYRDLAEKKAAEAVARCDAKVGAECVLCVALCEGCC